MSVHNWPVVGHEWAVKLLSQSLAHGRLRHAYLITGPEQVGKGTLARALAMALNCTGDNPPCGQCRSCRLIAQGRHPDVPVLRPVASQSGRLPRLRIAPIRELQRELALAPYEARFRVPLIRDFQYVTEGAANALLKTLEEPPSSVVLVLTARSADDLLPTITSRCQALNLRPLPLATVERALVEKQGASPEQARLLARLSGGRLGWAWRAWQEKATLASRAEHLQALVRLLGANRSDRFIYAQLTSQDKGQLRALLDVWRSWWRDATLLAAGEGLEPVNVDYLDKLEALAGEIGLEGAYQALQATLRAGEQLAQNANPRLLLEVLLLDYPYISI